MVTDSELAEQQKAAKKAAEEKRAAEEKAKRAKQKAEFEYKGDDGGRWLFERR